MGYGVVLAAMMVCSAGALAGQVAAKKPVAKAPAKPVVLSPAITSPTDTLTSKFTVAGIPVILRRVSANNVVAANLYLLGGTRQLTAGNQGIETLLLEASERGTAMPWALRRSRFQDWVAGWSTSKTRSPAWGLR